MAMLFGAVIRTFVEACMLYSRATDHTGPRAGMTEENKSFLRLLVIGAIGSSVALEVVAPNLPVHVGLAICGGVGLFVASVARTLRVV
jgi:hypothetical protein